MGASSDPTPVMPRTKLVGASGGDGGGKAADRRKGERRRAPRAQNRNRRVTEAVNLRIGGVQNRDHVRPSIGARCGKAARRDVCPAKAGMFSRGQTCRGRSQSPVVRIAEARETEPSKPIDKTSRGEVTSHRAVTKVNALWPRK